MASDTTEEIIYEHTDSNRTGYGYDWLYYHSNIHDPDNSTG